MTPQSLADLRATRTESASHWIRPCPLSAECKHERDRGWRLHVSFEDDDGYLEVTEEQVLPEKVERADANHHEPYAYDGEECEAGLTALDRLLSMRGAAK